MGDFLTHIQNTDSKRMSVPLVRVSKDETNGTLKMRIDNETKRELGMGVYTDWEAIDKYSGVYSSDKSLRASSVGEIYHNDIDHYTKMHDEYNSNKEMMSIRIDELRKENNMLREVINQIIG